MFDILTYTSEHEYVNLYMEHKFDKANIIGDGCTHVSLLEWHPAIIIENERDIEVEGAAIPEVRSRMWTSKFIC